MRQTLIGIGVMSALAAFGGIYIRAAQQPGAEPCAIGQPEQHPWRRQAIQLARAINTIEMKTFSSTKAYQPLTAFPEITVPDGLSVQLAVNDSGYIFTIKDASNRVGCAVFSDQTGLIYDAQPLR